MKNWIECEGEWFNLDNFSRIYLNSGVKGFCLFGEYMQPRIGSRISDYFETQKQCEEFARKMVIYPQ
jgi:hypothetical protein